MKAPELLVHCLANEAAFAGSRPAVVDVPVDYRENLKLTEELGRLVRPL